MPVTEDANEADSDVGFVTTNVEKGAIIVQHEDGRQFRLSWGESPESKPGGLRALPPGSYAWKGYRESPTRVFLRPHVEGDALAKGFGSKKSRASGDR